MSTARHRWRTATVVATLLGTFPVHAAELDAPASSFVATASGPSSSVVVDASEVGTMRPAMVEDVVAQATKVALEANIDPSAVTITFVEVDPVEVIRGVRVAISTPDATLSDPADPRGPLLAQCTACPDSDLSGLAVEAMLTAVQRHRALIQERQAATQLEPEPAPEPEPEPVATPEPPPKKKLGPLGWGGIAGLGLGVSATVAGAVLAALPPAPPPGEMRRDMLRDLRPAGYALVGTGAALLVTGAVLLGIDRRAARKSTLSLGPTPAPGSLGLSIRGRF